MKYTAAYEMVIFSASFITRAFGKRTERILGLAREWMGRLSAEQEQEIARMTMQFPDTLPSWYAHQLYRHEQLIALFESRKSDQTMERLQDWLIHPTDFSWRLETDKGGASSAIGDIGSHWCDLVQHVAGARITDVLADLTTVVKTRLKPAAATEAFAGAAAAVNRTEVTIESEDLATVLVRFDNGARGCVTVVT